MDYGGYTAPLAFLGRHAAGNAAVAVELALALWRKGFEIPDEAILAGLAAVENRSSIRVLSQKPSSSSTPAVLRSRLQPFCASSIWRRYAI